MATTLGIHSQSLSMFEPRRCRFKTLYSYSMMLLLKWNVSSTLMEIYEKQWVEDSKFSLSYLLYESFPPTHVCIIDNLKMIAKFKTYMWVSITAIPDSLTGILEDCCPMSISVV